MRTRIAGRQLRHVPARICAYIACACACVGVGVGVGVGVWVCVGSEGGAWWDAVACLCLWCGVDARVLRELARTRDFATGRLVRSSLD